VNADIGLPAVATLAGIAGAVAGIWLTGLRRRARVVAPFGAGLLVGVALFFLLPELGETAGWGAGALLLASGYLILFLVNRYVYPVCPTCSDDHDHDACATLLHGFAPPLVAAAAIHSFLDGWSVGAAGEAAEAGIRYGIPLAVMVHKIPEGLALGSILRAAVPSRWVAFQLCVLAQGTTLAGGAVGLLLGPSLGAGWLIYPLGVAGGCFIYIGVHAIHQEWKRRGLATACTPALAGAAGAAVLHRGVHFLLH
jgi:zinc and cadmium transporter